MIRTQIIRDFVTGNTLTDGLRNVFEGILSNQTSRLCEAILGDVIVAANLMFAEAVDRTTGHVICIATKADDCGNYDGERKRMEENGAFIDSVTGLQNEEETKQKGQDLKEDALKKTLQEEDTGTENESKYVAENQSTWQGEAHLIRLVDIDSLPSEGRETRIRLLGEVFG